MDTGAKLQLNQFIHVCINPALCPEDWPDLYQDFLVKHRDSMPESNAPRTDASRNS